MNITAYLPDELVQSLDRVARDLHSSRSAVMREALELYLRRMQPNAWPAAVMTWKREDFPAFESLRSHEQRQARDPFADAETR